MPKPNAVDPDPLRGRRMLVGIGAQKSGTTWLHRQLIKDRRVCMPIKELHHFDSLHRPELFGYWPDRVRERVLALEAQRASLDPRRLAELTLRHEHAALMQDPTLYMAFFRRHVTPVHRLFGEITPSYATLNEAGFRAIASSHEDVRVIFLLRDPVDRLVSGVRHELRQIGRSAQWSDIEAGLGEPAHLARARYDLTLSALDRVFPSNKVLLGFYEEMFEPRFCARVGAFLGLDGLAFEPAERIASDPTRPALTPGQRAQLRTALEPIYRYCLSRFGPALPKAWNY